MQTPVRVNPSSEVMGLMAALGLPRLLAGYEQ